MDDKEKIVVCDKVKSIVNSYCDRLIENGCIDPDNMDHDCFFEEIVSLFDRQKWKQVKSLPYTE